MQNNIQKDVYKFSYAMKKQLQKRIVSVFFHIVLVVCILAAFLSLCFFTVKQTSISMSPDIPKNSLLFVSHINEKPSRGDVFIIRKENNNPSLVESVCDAGIKFFTLQKKSLYSSSEQISSNKVLRRIVGVPGDTIYMKDYMLYIKPAGEEHFLTEFELTEKSYNIEMKKLPDNWDKSIGVKSDFRRIILGPDQYFVLADNRYTAADSRTWGVVENTELYAKCLLVYFPFKKIKLL